MRTKPKLTRRPMPIGPDIWSATDGVLEGVGASPDSALWDLERQYKVLRFEIEGGWPPSGEEERETPTTPYPPHQLRDPRTPFGTPPGDGIPFPGLDKKEPDDD